ncbi:SDR family oxidoreductase [Blastococcus saxobsidens]|uniref:SDR family oxidoreductase n=1 Tax=Blastococcus saxobsidens TaxID=138336 RepID=A0A6L9W466_9ACTN|nr:SDR family NAD(P)-dependent oxidoreductase [Blastococcus saxobsidens]NEK86876.1 SDR family oxidoreductase [Blastococcus saxobsidens]
MSGTPGTELTGRRVLVTGAARGLGRSITSHLASAGARVLAVDIDEDGLAEAATGWSNLGEVHTARCDVSDEVSVNSAVDEASRALGGLDGVVNNAAIVSVTRAPAQQVPVEEFDRVFAVNVRGPWLVYRATARLLAASDCAGIVNLSSETAFSGSRNMAHYVGSKAAVIGLTRALAREAGQSDIRVNAVAPGFTDTEGARAIGDPDTYDTTGTPLGRVGVPADVVGAVAFLLSPAAAFISGQVLLVNGGRVAG